jgi:phage/plasmid primase-like uncharacterized protein
MRIEAGSLKTARNGAYVHRLIETSPTPQRPYQKQSAPTVETVQRIPPEQLHVVYLTLLREHLVLAESHRASLRARGLSDAAIECADYRSTPAETFAKHVARALAKEFDLRGVPGFYRDASGTSQMMSFGAGFYVPVRDHRGLICGLQIRRDEGTPKYLWLSSANRTDGCSSGAPVHFASAHLLRETEEVTITEGALKGEIIAYLTRSPVIAAAGVSNFGADFAETLKKAFPNLRRATLCFDMDVWTNEHVYGALDRLAQQLKAARFSVTVRTWPKEFKGFDDFLVAELGREEVAA